MLKKEILELRENGSTIIFSTHNMDSVEELCDHIALINKSVKIVDGPTNEIRQRYKSNIFEITYKGNFEQVASLLQQHFIIVGHTEQASENILRVQHINGKGNNELIRIILPSAEILSFREIIPGMNDVFIKAVHEANNKK